MCAVSRSFLPFLACLCAPHARAADVLVVGPSEPYPTIGIAVASAGEGDTILVKSGSYGPFSVQGKGLSIVADAGADVTVTGGVVIFDVGAGKTVLLDRITIQAQAPGVESLSVLSVAGSLRVQECTLLGADGDAFLIGCATLAGISSAGATVRVGASTDVAFTRCTIVGGDGSTVFDPACSALGIPWIGGNGGAGLTLFSSTATAYDCDIVAGNGGDATQGGSGGFGVSVSAGSLLVMVHGEVAGGDGGASVDPLVPAAGGAGGHALALDLGARAILLDDHFDGGAGGTGAFGMGAAGLDLSGPGVATLLPGAGKSLTVAGVLREGESTAITVTGAPGELASLFVAPDAGFLLVPKAKGVLHLGLDPLLGPLPLGTIDASGSASLVAVIPDLPAGLAGLDVWLQALVSAGPAKTLSSWAHLTLLDASF